MTKNDRDLLFLSDFLSKDRVQKLNALGFTCVNAFMRFIMTSSDTRILPVITYAEHNQQKSKKQEILRARHKHINRNLKIVYTSIYDRIFDTNLLFRVSRLDFHFYPIYVEDVK